MKIVFLFFILVFFISCGDDSKTEKSDADLLSDTDQVDDSGKSDDSNQGGDSGKTDDSNTKDDGDKETPDDGKEDNDQDPGNTDNDPVNKLPSVEIKCGDLKTNFDAECTLTASDPDGDDVTLTVNSEDTCGGTIESSVYSFLPGNSATCKLVIDANDGKDTVKIEKELSIFNNPYLVKDMNREKHSNFIVKSTVKVGEKNYIFGHIPFISSGLFEVDKKTGELTEIYTLPFMNMIELQEIKVTGDKLVMALRGEADRERFVLVSDGTTEGTEKVLSMNDRRRFENYLIGDTLYFAWYDKDSVAKLWKSDGTKAGTVACNTFGKDAQIEILGAAAGKLIMKVYAGAAYELHVRDENGALSKIDEFSTISDAVTFGDKVVFSAGKTATGRELYVTDGSAQNTALLKDIAAEGSGSDPEILGVVGSKLVFSANDGVHGRELWITDGTDTGTKLFKEIKEGAEGIDNATFINGDSKKLFFVASETLYVTDGTETGTDAIDLSEFKIDSYNLRYMENHVVIDSVLYFFMRGEGGYKLLKSDGKNTEKLMTTELEGSIGGDLDGALIYSETMDEAFSSSVLRNLSTGEETRMIFDGMTDNGPAMAVGVKNDKLWFVSIANGWESLSFISSDGTPEGTVEELDVAEELDVKIEIETALSNNIQQIGEKFFLRMKAPASGEELWITDGTKAGTKMVKDINPGKDGSRPRFLAEIGGKLFFTAEDGTNNGLWVTDGTEAGTELLQAVRYGLRFIEYKGKALFSFKELNRDEIWESDGTKNGTKMLINVKEKNLDFVNFQGVLGDNIFFTANMPGNKQKMVVSKGNADTAEIIWDLNAEGEWIDVEKSFVEGDLIYFFIKRGDKGELWKSDGTKAGTAKVTDLAAGLRPGWEEPRKVGSNLFFTARREKDDFSLFSYNFTSKTEAKLMDLSATGCGQVGLSMEFMSGAAGNKLYFTACDAEHGFELHSSDGTAAGTSMVYDINPGPDSSLPFLFHTAPDGKAIYFNANDGVHGYELHRLDIAE